MRDKTRFVRFSFWMILAGGWILGFAGLAAAEGAPDSSVNPERSAEAQVASRLPDAKTTSQAVNGSIFSKFFVKEPTVITPKEYIRSGYVIKDQEPHGKIIRNYDFWNSISEGEEVFVDFGTNKGAKPGDKFIIYLLNENFGQGFDYQRPVNHPVLNKEGKAKEEYVGTDLWNLDRDKDFGTWRKTFTYIDKIIKHQGNNEGDMVRIVGVLEIVEPEGNMSRAMVAEMWDWIPRGAYLTPYPESIPPMLPLNYQAKAKNLSGYILDNREGFQMAGENDIVYIDLGSTDQVQPGDRFDVIAGSYSEKLVRRSLEPIVDEILDKDERKLMDRKIGQILVISAELETATAIVTDSKESILPGHRVRSSR